MAEKSFIPDEWRRKRGSRNPDGSLNLIDPDALAVSDLAQQLYCAYFSHIAAITVAADPRSNGLMPPRKPGMSVPIGEIRGKAGTMGGFHFEHYLSAIRTDPFVQDSFSKVFLAGAIIDLGDALSRHHYLNHQPELELLYHVRNGVAHGNRFNIDQRGQNRLAKYPAHDKAAISRNREAPPFVITPDLHGMPVLFDFMESGDVVSLLQGVCMYCRELAYGTVGYRDVPER